MGENSNISRQTNTKDRLMAGEDKVETDKDTGEDAYDDTDLIIFTKGEIEHYEHLKMLVFKK